MQRDPRFDSFRGLFLVLMTVGHNAGPLGALIDKPLGLGAGAEHFVLVSAIVCGMSYTRAYVAGGRDYLRSRVFSRAAMIWGAHLLCVLVVAGLVNFSPIYAEKWGPRGELFLSNPVVAVVLSSLLLYQPVALRTLPMFVVYFCITPFVIEALCEGRWKKVFMISFSVWLATQVLFALVGFKLVPLENHFFQDLGIVNLGVFFIPGWQFLYVLGLFWGAYISLNPGKVITPKKPLMLIGGFFFLVFAAIRYRYGLYYLFGLDETSRVVHLLEFLWYARGNAFFGPLVLLNYIAFLYIFVPLFRAKPSWFNWPIFALIGRYPLHVFTFHVIFRVLISPLEPTLSTVSFTEGLLFTLVIAGSLWVPALLADRLVPKEKRSKGPEIGRAHLKPALG